jgi:isoleucyl-tRNA synthetase
VRNVLKDVFLPWFNSYRFFVMSALLYNSRSDDTFTADPALALSSTNIMDKWILAAANSLIKYVRSEMNTYHLYTVVRGLLQLIEQLTNWYIKFNRRRLKGEEGDAKDWRTALATLFEVLLTLCRYVHTHTHSLSQCLFVKLILFIIFFVEDLL